MALVLDALARRYPAYDAERILSEHAELIDDWVFIAAEEAQEQKREQKRLEARHRRR